MSLHFDYTRIAPESRAKYPAAEDGTVNPVTWALTMGTMIVGLGRITQANLAEWQFRAAFQQRLHGAWLRRWDETMERSQAVEVTAEQIADHIGLSCNVSDETRASWVKRQVESFARDLAYAEQQRARKAA